MPLTPIQKRNVVQISIGSLAILMGLCVVSLLGVGGIPLKAEAAEDACCKAGDATPPLELVKQVPKGELHSPFPDYAKLAKDDPDLVKQFRLPGCNECHGGGGGGGILTQGVWFWGNTDDVLFRLVMLGSVDLEKQGYKRLSIAFIRSINPPGANPPDKVLP